MSDEAKKELDSFIPADFEKYTNIIKGDFEKYIFYKRYRNGDMHCLCSYCEEKYVINPKAQRTFVVGGSEDIIYHSTHRSYVCCPKCGKAAQLISPGKFRNLCNISEYKRYAFCENKDDEVFIRCYYVSKKYDEQTLQGKITFTLDRAYHLSKGRAASIVKGYYGDCYYDHGLHEPFLCGYSFGRKYLDYEIIGLYEVMKSTYLKYSAFDEYKELLHVCRYNRYGEFNIKPIRYLALYSIYNSIEMFVKLGFIQAVREFVIYKMPNLRLINWSADKPVECFRVLKNKQEFKELREVMEKRCIGEISLLKTFKQMRKLDDKITLSVACDYCGLEKRSIDTLKSMMDLTGKSLIQCSNYIQNLDKNCGHLLSDYWLTIYRDYISAARELKYDLSQETVAMPKDLMKAHDKAIALVKYEQDQQKMLKMKQLDKQRKKKYEYSDGTFCIILPPTIQSIIDEGRALKHCVGGYADRHADGTTTILFLRTCKNMNVPFYTIEIKGNQLFQYHGYRNDAETNHKPLPEVKEFVEKWLKWVIAGSKPQKRKIKKSA